MPCRASRRERSRPAGTGPDDAYLGAHGRECDARTRRWEPRLPLSGNRGCAPAPGRCPARRPRAPARAGAGRGGAGGRRCRGRPPPTGPLRPLHLHRDGQRRGARRHLLARCGRSRRRRTSASSRRIRPGSTTVCRVSRVSDRSACSTTSCGAAASSTLPTPVACSGQPAAHLAHHRHRLAAGDPLDVERGQPVPDGEVHGVADRVCTSSRNGAATWRSSSCTGASRPRSHSLRPIS